MKATSSGAIATGGAAVPTITKVRGIVLIVLGLGIAVTCGAVLINTLPSLLDG